MNVPLVPKRLRPLIAPPQMQDARIMKSSADSLKTMVPTMPPLRVLILSLTFLTSSERAARASEPLMGG